MTCIRIIRSEKDPDQAVNPRRKIQADTSMERELIGGSRSRIANCNKNIQSGRAPLVFDDISDANLNRPGKPFLHGLNRSIRQMHHAG
jgi:hypothetical protein